MRSKLKKIALQKIKLNIKKNFKYRNKLRNLLENSIKMFTFDKKKFKKRFELIFNNKKGCNIVIM